MKFRFKVGQNRVDVLLRCRSTQEGKSHRLCTRSLAGQQRCREQATGQLCELYALAAVGCTSWKRTETSLETPGSCIVTPYMMGAILIVFLLCVIRMNCV